MSAAGRVFREPASAFKMYDQTTDRTYSEHCMKNVMVVDDEALITAQLEERLTTMGYNVVGRASSGEEGISLARDIHPDIVLMDIVMPGSLDGIDASEIIINELDIPVIFLTAYGDDAYIDRAKKICPSGYIIKPYHPDEIKAAIEIATAQKSQRIAPDSIIERFRLLADSLPFGIALVNSEFRIVFWNKEAAHITGYTENDAVDLSFNFFIDEPHRDIIALKAAALLTPAARLESARPLLFDDIPGSRKDCSEAVYSFSLSACRVESESILLCAIRDITEQKHYIRDMVRAMKEKETLYRETSHHIKNDLQIISNLLFLQSQDVRTRDIHELFRECSNRIQAISIIHQKLYASNEPGTIDFKEYLSTILKNLLYAYSDRSRSVRITTNIQPLRLDLKRARSCGLIVNELVTNSFKHAFPGDIGNEITIEFALDQESGTYTLIVRDNGVGMPDELDCAKPKSMGLQIVTILVNDMRGAITRGGKGGAEFIISFK